MKKLLIIILILIGVSANAQYLETPKLNPAKSYTWTGKQTYTDSMFVKYLRFGNDTLGYLGNGKIYAPNGSLARPSYSFGTSRNTGLYWDGSTIIIAVGGVINSYISSSYYLGRDLLSFTNKSNDVGSSANAYKNVYTGSLNLGIDSTGAIVDSVYISRHTLLVNCGASDSNVVWLSDHNVTAGQRYMVKKIDANSTNVIVKSKTGFPIDGAISKIWNTQYQTFTFVYRNRTWYIL